MIQPPSSTEPPFAIPPATRLGHVHLTVASLDRQIAFYQEVLGFTLRWRAGASVGLGAGGEDLLRLTEVPGARRTHRTTGLYHFALLYPSRRELARALARLFALRYPNHPTDHVVSKTTYLDDPEGNNIELYVRTLDEGTFEVIDGNLVVRRADGTPSDGREPLDVGALLQELTPDDRLDLPLPGDTVLGHVHLYAASLAESMRFYHGVLGFRKGPVSTSFRMGDVGLDERQPHVIAFNTWHGDGAPPPADALGMRYFTIVLPSAADRDHTAARAKQAGIATEETTEGVSVQDPSQNRVVLSYISSSPTTANVMMRAACSSS